MILALLAFGWFWWSMHHPPVQRVTAVSVIHLSAPAIDGGDH
jgi:hypothetical protein